MSADVQLRKSLSTSFTSSLFRLFVGLLIVSPHLLPTSKAVHFEYCMREKFEASCTGQLDDQVPLEGRILITSALYGRTKLGRCIQREFDGFQGCSVDVLNTLDQLCSGRQSCSVDVFQTFGGLRPCSELESFLEAEYECVPAIPACSGVINLESMTSPEVNFLSSLGSRDLDSEAESSSILSPLSVINSVCQTTIVLRAKPGKQWNITLLDFSIPVHNSQTGNRKTSSATLGIGSGGREASGIADTLCVRYAVVGEANKESVLPGTTVETSFRDAAVVCGGSGNREKSVYLSESSTVRIDLYGRRSNVDEHAKQFLVKVEAVGCADGDATVPNGIAIRRKPDLMAITCNSTGLEYQLRCVKNAWIGSGNNSCTPTDAASVWSLFQHGWTSVSGILIVTALGIALGVCVGCSLLALAAICHKYREHVTKGAGTSLQTPDCHLSSTYCASHMTDYRSSTAPNHGAKYFDSQHRQTAGVASTAQKYGTNPAYSAMINEFVVTGQSNYATNKAGTANCSVLCTGACCDHAGLPIQPEVAPNPPNNSGRLRLVPQQPSAFTWNAGPEVASLSDQTRRNYFYAANDTSMISPSAGENIGVEIGMDGGSRANTADAMCVTAYLVQHGGGESCSANAADGYNESLMSNASSLLDDHIYEIAG